MARSQIRNVAFTALRRASGRSHYIKGGSNEHDISEEVRDLIRNAKTQENIDEWNLGRGIGEPYKLSMKDPDDPDDTSIPDAVYFPHAGERFKEKFEALEASPVFVVKQVSGGLFVSRYSARWI